MKIRFIINPVAGTGKQKGIEQCIAKHLENYEIVYTKKAGDATRLSKEAEKKILLQLWLLVGMERLMSV